MERGYGVHAFDTPWGRRRDARLRGCLALPHGDDRRARWRADVFVLAAAPARGTAPREDTVPAPRASRAGSA